MIVLQHLAHDEIEASSTRRWFAYALFTLAVGVLLLLNWQGVFTQLFGIDTAIIVALVGGYKIYYNTIAALFERRIIAELAIVIAIVAALAVGENLAAAEAVFIMLVGTGLEEFAARRTRSAMNKLIDLTPKRARLKLEEGEREVAVDEVNLGDVVIVRPGEQIPVDGVIVAGAAAINEAALTGESLPVDKAAGAQVFAGSLNTIGALEVRVTRTGHDTTLAKIIHLIEDAERQKAPAVRAADAAAQFFLPLVLVVAALTYYLTGDWLRTVAVLLVACPCALILATPAAVVAAIGRLARAGVLVKSGASLEAFARVAIIVFDKTGTVTEGKPAIKRIHSFNGKAENELLQLAALAEQRSEHPIAQTIVTEARQRGLFIATAEEFKVEPGLGVEARANGQRVLVGNRRLMEARAIGIDEQAEAFLGWLELEGRSPLFVAENGALQGVISLQDRLRDETRATVAQLHQQGIKRVVLLSGDRQNVAQNIAQQAGVDEVRAELLPQQKVEQLRLLQRDGKVAMVGDGLNDAPALAAADVGIAMGAAGTDVTIAEADIVLMNDRLERLPLLVDVSRATLRIIRQNIIGFALVFNVLAVFAAYAGWVTPAGAAVLHQVSALLVVLNSLRLLAYGRLRENKFVVAAQQRYARAFDAVHERSHTLDWRRAQVWVKAQRAWLLKRALVVGALLWLLSGLYIIGPDEAAVVTRFGRLQGEPAGPGLLWRLPWPIDRITRLKPQQVQVAELGFRTSTSTGLEQTTDPAAYEWSSQHRSGRYERQPDEALVLTGDENLIEVNTVVQYAIATPAQYLFNATEPQQTLRVAAEAVLRALVGKAALDTVLTSGRSELEQQAKALLQTQLDAYRTGLRVVAVQLQDVHPSVEVVSAFREVASSVEEKSRLINQAEGYRNEQLALARGQALARLAEAAGYTAARANRAEGDAERFNQFVEAFKTAPGVTQTRLYLETIEQVLPGKKKLIVDASKFGRRQMLLVDPQGMPLDLGGTGLNPGKP